MKGKFSWRLWLDIGIILGSFVFLGLGAYVLAGAVETRANRILTDKAAVANYDTDLETLNRLKNASEDADVLKKKIDALLPQEDALIGFPQFFTNLGRTHSLAATFSFTASPVSPAPPAAGNVSFAANLNGSPGNIRDFLLDLETNTTRFAVNLEELDFASGDDSSQATIKGKIFFK